MKPISLTRLSRSLAGLSRPLNYRLHPPRLSPSTPEEYLRFGLYRFRSPLLTVSISLSFPPLTEMFHFSGYRSRRTILFIQQYQSFTSDGFPHSDISGLKPACGSPKLFAVDRVLLRLLAPRHPPYALNILTFSPSASLLRAPCSVVISTFLL